MLYLNSIQVPVTMFPDGTSQVWKLDTNLILQHNHIIWEFSSESEVMHLAQLVDLLHSQNCNNSLIIKYLPYGRQDKEITNDSTFALRTFAKILNSMNFAKVSIIDPHSIIALQLIRNSEAIYETYTVAQITYKHQIDLLCFPDKGAFTKYSSMFTMPYAYGEKVRDQLTGNIVSYKLIGDPKDKNVLIVDDICDGGMTFKLLAKDLLAAGAKEVNLFVTHGIFSKGLRTLKDSNIKRIFTKDGEASEVQNQITYRRL